MGVYRRKGSPYWYIRIGAQVDRSSRTTRRDEALALEAKWRTELWRDDYLGQAPERTFAEAAAQWAEDVGRHRKGWDRDWYRLRKLVRAIGEHPIRGLDEGAVRLGIPPDARSPASRNHYLSLVRSVLRHARREGLSSADLPTLRFERADNARTRFLRDWTEANRLIDAMPAHWRDPARFTLLTGVRQGTLRALRREWLTGDLLVVPGPFTKSGRQLPIPLHPDALIIAQRQPERPWLFTRPNGQPLPKMSSHVWHRVLAKAGIEDFRWHDLRHTWASWCVMNGIDLYELQQLGDWSTSAMVQRYAHLHPDYLREAVKKIRSAELRHPDAEGDGNDRQ